MTRFARIFLALYLCGIVYLSLYPWDFQSRPRSLELLRAPLYNRRLVLDFVMNVAFYMPLGAAAFASLRRGWKAWLAAALFGAALSYATETAQLYTPQRAATVRDVQANALGAAVGAALAWLLTSPRWISHWRGLRRSHQWALSPTGAAFLILWTLWQTFPFIPYVGWYRVQSTLLDLGSAPWSWLNFGQACAGFLVLARVLGPSRWLWIAFALLPMQIALVDHNFSPPSILGAAVGWIAARYLAPRNGHWWIAGALVLWLAFEEFRPFRWAAVPQRFNWSPGESWFQAGFAAYYSTISRKLFLYTSVVLSIRAVGARWKWALGVPMLIIAVGEWAQQYLEGRTPESTDLFLLAAGAGTLAFAEWGRPAAAGAVSGRPAAQPKLRE